MAGLSERLGIFGGTFDPPHMGHLILAEEAFHQLGLDRVLWVLTPDPPHKQGHPVVSLENRLEMLQAALGEHPNFEISRVEIERPSPYYAVDTVRILKEQQPQARIIYLMGGDSLRDLPTWKKPQEFADRCDGIGVMRRYDDHIDMGALEGLLPGVSNKIIFVQAPLVDISASLIRTRIAQGGAFRYYLHPAVYNLVIERGYYRS